MQDVASGEILEDAETGIVVMPVLQNEPAVRAFQDIADPVLTISPVLVVLHGLYTFDYQKRNLLLYGLFLELYGEIRIDLIGEAGFVEGFDVRSFIVDTFLDGVTIVVVLIWHMNPPLVCFLYHTTENMIL